MNSLKRFGLLLFIFPIVLVFAAVWLKEYTAYFSLTNVQNDISVLSNVGSITSSSNLNYEILTVNNNNININSPNFIALLVTRFDNKLPTTSIYPYIETSIDGFGNNTIVLGIGYIDVGSSCTYDNTLSYLLSKNINGSWIKIDNNEICLISYKYCNNNYCFVSKEIQDPIDPGIAKRYVVFVYFPMISEATNNVAFTARFGIWKIS